ncbi:MULTISPECIES: putative quinol monooxygenase [unclassified Pseudomonas]|uniref:putative quinol monooxygenase n=1 Tax=unclassified Pseudomonas TaxID=196821 RepID=UPI002AC90A8B|nr:MULTISPECIES: putative quinol monooxygenase [unclassified Pseudomonas]MEB0043215.1 putative quinol monooxygenase [Pseudomonas sp. MH10]MEB0080119.1 putative quinol monooxygenase [Pseudomonas sp. MH10out]MEB0094092.1 putative quinol monooxygenase [Pseudomonas sp. CCI4.2]MEB0104440.1 putative quinol monooxygenase [Pseudomonas sp. CCI3.2]MEB0123432.1 putative quinol monooxygenase [Pseudomonas sp. CCI1.2]
MSQPLTVIATLIAKAGHEADLEKCLRGILEPTRAEAGCLGYDLHQDLEHSASFYMIERWNDDAALQTHSASAHIQAFRAEVGEHLEHFILKRVQHLA